MSGVTTLRLVTKPNLQRRHGELVHIDKFEASLDGKRICISRQPRLDGARELLRRGYSPDTLMTTRAHDRGYDSFVPAPIGELAGQTVVESNRDGLQRRPWKSFESTESAPPVDRRTRKPGLRGVKVPGQDDDAVTADSGEAARRQTDRNVDGLDFNDVLLGKGRS